MRYNQDKYGNDISTLSFGCMRLPKNYSQAEKLISKAFENGINYFDTAYIYPGNEELLGKAVKSLDIRKKIKITSKLPLMFCKKHADFDKYFEATLDRLQTNYLDYYLLHMLTTPSQLSFLFSLGLKEWIEEKQRCGAIGQVGFSFHGGCTDFLDILEMYDWDICMIQYNYADENYQAGVRGLKAANAKGIPVMIMEPLFGGRLAVNLPRGLSELFDSYEPYNSPASWALKWLWNQPEVTSVLSGMNGPEQLEENIKAANESSPNMFSPKEELLLAAAQNVFKSSNKINCTGCGYCMPCPKGVNIPACFSAYNSTYSSGRYVGLRHYYMSTGLTSPDRSHAALCVGCKKCEHHCPQKLEISRELRLVSKKLEPWWAKPVVGGARLFLRAKKKKK